MSDLTMVSADGRSDNIWLWETRALDEDLTDGKDYHLAIHLRLTRV